jgi:putative addiction module component (TIGR02574 family)
MTLPKFDVAALTPEERLELIEKLWDSLEETHVPLSSQQQSELTRRLDDMAKNPNDQVTWEEVQRRVWGSAR